MYKADIKDSTYTRNYYNFEDHSIILLRSEDAITEELAEKVPGFVKSDLA